MEYRIPKKGEIYRHFKGNFYEIVLIARDSETLEEKVVYKELEGDAAYVRSLPMFVSLVDKTKYPDAMQEFRFEFMGETASKTDIAKEPEATLQNHSMIMEFLDLNEVHDKILYLQSVKEQITEEFIGAAAQSLDFIENEGTLAKRYEAMLRYLRTIEKYEKGRIR